MHAEQKNINFTEMGINFQMDMHLSGVWSLKSVFWPRISQDSRLLLDYTLSLVLLSLYTVVHLLMYSKNEDFLSSHPSVHSQS